MKNFLLTLVRLFGAVEPSTVLSAVMRKKMPLLQQLIDLGISHNDRFFALAPHIKGVSESVLARGGLKFGRLNLEVLIALIEGSDATVAWFEQVFGAFSVIPEDKQPEFLHRIVAETRVAFDAMYSDLVESESFSEEMAEKMAEVAKQREFLSLETERLLNELIELRAENPDVIN